MDDWKKNAFSYVTSCANKTNKKCKINNLSLFQFARERNFCVISLKGKSASGQRNLLRGNKRDTIFIISRGATLNHGEKKHDAPCFRVLCDTCARIHHASTISHRASRLTKYSRRTDINSCFFFAYEGRGRSQWRFGGFFAGRGPLKSVRRNAEITVDAAAGAEGGPRAE